MRPGLVCWFCYLLRFFSYSYYDDVAFCLWKLFSVDVLMVLCVYGLLLGMWFWYVWVTAGAVDH